jgi:hypothetical protein
VAKKRSVTWDMMARKGLCDQYDIFRDELDIEKTLNRLILVSGSSNPENIKEGLRGNLDSVSIDE